MRDFRTLESAIHRSTLLAAGACAALLAIAVSSLAYAFLAAGNAREVGARMPVLVVPGAIAGVYTPGLTEDNIRATARYLASLATNFTGSTGFRERFDELEAFASPQFLPSLQRARRVLQHDVETQNQARAFFASGASEQLQQADGGRFDYRVQGERVVYSSGVPMDNRRSEVHLRLRWGAPSRHNQAGIVLEGFEVSDVNNVAEQTSAAGRG